MSAADETDRELWPRAVCGDDAAFRAIYDRYAQRLLTYSYRRLASRPRAEDVVSLVMLEAWRRRHAVRFGDDGSLAGWLFRTAQYVLANELRSVRRHRAALDRIAGCAGAVALTEELDRHLIDEERLQRVLATLGQLPPRDREVLALAAWSGLAEKDMATALGVPVGTLKSRLSRARQRLAARSDGAAGPPAVRPDVTFIAKGAG